MIDLSLPKLHDWNFVTPGDLPDFINVVCVASGDKYNEEFVDKLKRGVARNLSIFHTFQVIRDEQIPEEDRGSWWAKLSMFNPAVVPKGLTLYFDVDVVITDVINELTACTSDRPLTILKNFSMNTAHCAYNSSVMLFNSGDPRITNIWETYQANKKQVKETLHGDQCFIWRVLKDDTSNFPESSLVSYKYHCRYKDLPKDAKAVIFHGKPDPNEVNDEWVKENWI
jgi:lipopolysaccharide biosynthesis glycosyltransferase